MSDDEQPRTLRLWGLKSTHVSCSGLRATRVGIVHGQAYCWRVYCPQHGVRFWKVERVRIRSVDDKREDGEAVDVAHMPSRTEACDAIDEDAKLLDALGPIAKRPTVFERAGGAE